MSKNKVPTAEETKAKIEELRNEITESIKNKKARISPVQIFLNEIKEIISDAIKNDISYAQISRDINTIFSFKVSTQTLRAFAHNELNIPKRKKPSSSPSTKGVKDKVYVFEDDPRKATEYADADELV